MHFTTDRLERLQWSLTGALNQEWPQLIAQLQGIPVKERLEHVAWDDLHSLAFYPASLPRPRLPAGDFR